jgi:hypothetical protein
MGCGDAQSCSVGESDGSSLTIGFSASLSPVSWISGGFDVSMSYNTGRTYACSANSHEVVCEWYNMAHTAYTVQNMYRNCHASRWRPDGPTFVMKSPNVRNRGAVGHYCVVNTCRSIWDNYWDNDGPAGGPQ